MANKGSILITVPIQLRADFKAWCKGQGVSVNQGFKVLMKTVVKGKFVLRQSIKEVA